MVEQWLDLLSHRKRVLGSNLCGVCIFVFFFYQGALVSPATNKNARSVPSVFAYFILHKELCLTLEVNRILSYFSSAKAEKKTLTVALNCLC